MSSWTARCVANELVGTRPGADQQRRTATVNRVEADAAAGPGRAAPCRLTWVHSGPPATLSFVINDHRSIGSWRMQRGRGRLRTVTASGPPGLSGGGPIAVPSRVVKNLFHN